jgi:cytidylate kinase
MVFTKDGAARPNAVDLEDLKQIEDIAELEAEMTRIEDLEEFVRTWRDMAMAGAIVDSKLGTLEHQEVIGDNRLAVWFSSRKNKLVITVQPKGLK